MTVPAVTETSALAILPGQTEWTPVQQAAFASIGLADVPDPDKLAFLHLCQAKGLDPWQREIYLIGREVKVKKKKANGQGFDEFWETRYTPQTGIDGYLTLAERTGQYRGRIIQWCGYDEVWKDLWSSADPPVAARAGVFRHGNPEPVWAVAHWVEYVPLTDEWVDTPSGRRKSGNKIPSGMWAKMPAGQLGKVALALGLRATFPRQMNGVYVDEEMHQADAAARDAEAERQAAVRAQGLAEIRGKVIDAVPAVTREDMMAEFAGQAAVLGRTPEELAGRWQQRHGRPLADATDAELWELIVGYREVVLAAVRGDDTPPVTAEQAASSRAAETPVPAPEGNGEASEGAGTGQVSRETLLAELAAQAEMMGRTVGQYTTRLIARYRCPLEQVPDDGLAEFLAAQRPIIAEKQRAETAPAQAAAEPVVPPAGTPVTALERHPFAAVGDGSNAECDEPGCGRPVDDDIHAPTPGAGQEPLL